MTDCSLDHLTSRIGALAEELIEECGAEPGSLKVLAGIFALQAAKIEKALSGADSAAQTFEAMADTIRTDPDAVSTTTMHVSPGD
jgi:hypothetical protein